MSASEPMGFRTRAIHVGAEPCPQTGAVVRPLHLASTFAQPGAGEWGEFDYSRSGSPTRADFEAALADLEGGVRALAYASGMAATHGATMLLKPGDHVVAAAELYGGTYRLLHKVCADLGIETTHVPTNDLAACAAAFRPGTKLFWTESLGNPLLGVTDLAACAELAHRHGAWLAVDNTFASPALLRPLELGADIVMHSATKYIGGHSDLLGGALVVRDAALGQRLYFCQNAAGTCMGALESYLARRGLKTLDLRMRAHGAAAQSLAEWLAAHPQVAKVHYPGLPTHPGHELARRLMPQGFGAVLSFELAGDGDRAKRFVKATKLFALAVSLGAVESLISVPALMSHASYEPAARRAAGIGDGLIRLSVGLEDTADLIADLERGFAA
jgi:cystathionine gamma-lyase